MDIDITIEHKYLAFGFIIDVDENTWLSLDDKEKKAYIAELTRGEIDDHLTFDWSTHGNEERVSFSLMND